MKERFDLPVSGTDHRLLVDAADYPRASKRTWEWNGKSVVTRYARAGRYRVDTVARYLLDMPKGVRVRFVSGDRFDARRENLVPMLGVVRRDLRCPRTPWTASVGVDGADYWLGMFRREAWAREAAAAAARVAPGLRGRGLTKREIQRALDIATGRRLENERDYNKETAA